MNTISIQQEPFDICAVQEEMCQSNSAIGAVVTFIGQMRDINEGETVNAMTLEHYPGMTEKALEKILSEADERWDLLGIRVIHRIGKLQPLEPIVLVAVASTHRGEAFQACEFVIDYLKTRAPFWKKEQTASGERWVDARDGDTEAEKRWS